MEDSAHPCGRSEDHQANPAGSHDHTRLVPHLRDSSIVAKVGSTLPQAKSLLRTSRNLQPLRAPDRPSIPYYPLHPGPQNTSMRNASWLSLLLSTALLPAQTSVSNNFPQPCADVESAALALFEHNRLPLSPDPACPLCFAAKSEHLRDAAGHPVRSTGLAIRRYMDTSRDARDIPGSWYVHRGLTTRANLRLVPEPPGSPVSPGCTAHLLFHYSWYATEILVILPVDGDPAARPSNLRLEHEYLDRIATNLKPHT